MTVSSHSQPHHKSSIHHLPKLPSEKIQQSLTQIATTFGVETKFRKGQKGKHNKHNKDAYLVTSLNGSPRKRTGLLAPVTIAAPRIRQTVKLENDNEKNQQQNNLLQSEISPIIDTTSQSRLPESHLPDQIPRASDRARQQLINYLSNERCTLFVEEAEIKTVGKILDEMIHLSGNKSHQKLFLP